MVEKRSERGTSLPVNFAQTELNLHWKNSRGVTELRGSITGNNRRKSCDRREQCLVGCTFFPLHRITRESQRTLLSFTAMHCSLESVNRAGLQMLRNR